MELPWVLNAVIECSSCSSISIYGSSSPAAEHQAFDPCNRPKKGAWFESNCEDAVILSFGISPLSIPRALLHFSSNNDDKRKCKRYMQRPREGLRSFKRVQANCMLATYANHPSNHSILFSRNSPVKPGVSIHEIVPLITPLAHCFQQWYKLFNVIIRKCYNEWDLRASKFSITILDGNEIALKTPI